MNTEIFNSYDTGAYRQFTSKAEIERDFRHLIGILTGIQCDKEISQDEINELRLWILKTSQFANRHPYQTVLDVLYNALEDNILTDDEIACIKWHCNQFIEEVGYYGLITASVQNLTGIIQGIIIDDKIKEKEITFLEKWLEKNSGLKNSWPYDELYSIVAAIVSDQHIAQEECNMLLNFCKTISNKVDQPSNSNLVEMLQMGFCHIDPEIVIPEKTFCLTGNSKKYKRKEIAQRIELHGGYVTNSVSAKLNYLIVCDEKTACWAFTCYGRKIEEAVNHRKAGKNIVIAHENDLYDALESLN